MQISVVVDVGLIVLHVICQLILLHDYVAP